MFPDLTEGLLLLTAVSSLLSFNSSSFLTESLFVSDLPVVVAVAALEPEEVSFESSFTLDSFDVVSTCLSFSMERFLGVGTGLVAVIGSGFSTGLSVAMGFCEFDAVSSFCSLLTTDLSEISEADDCRFLERGGLGGAKVLVSVAESLVLTSSVEVVEFMWWVSVDVLACTTDSSCYSYSCELGIYMHMPYGGNH